MRHHRRHPMPVRPHRKRGLPPAPGPSPALVAARQRLADEALTQRAAWRVESVRSGACTPEQGLQGLYEDWMASEAQRKNQQDGPPGIM